MADENMACKNTDREIWRERPGDFYADSIFVTEGGGIGIDCGGYVYVKPIREWHRLAGGKEGFGGPKEITTEEGLAMEAFGGDTTQPLSD